MEMLPAEVGAAAAYEAYRMWKHHRGALFAPLGGLSDRERDALIGLAIGEGTFLENFPKHAGSILISVHFRQRADCGHTLGGLWTHTGNVTVWSLLRRQHQISVTL